MKILVTGSTGFIGGYVLKELLKLNCNIVATGTKKANQINCDWIDNVNYIQANLNDKKENWFSFFDCPDILIHLAWQGLPNYNELYHIEQNLNNNYSFIKNMAEKGLKKILVTGTCFEYGLQNGMLVEDGETNPINTYALAKDCLRKYLLELQRHVKFDLLWVRLFYMFGKGQSSSSILSQLEKALENKNKSFNMSGGEQLRDYLPVEKVAEYLIKIATQEEVKGVINCCSGEPISIINLVENYLKKVKKKINLNKGFYSYADYEPMAYWGDVNKLNKAINSKNIYDE